MFPSHLRIPPAPIRWHFDRALVAAIGLTENQEETKGVGDHPEG